MKASWLRKKYPVLWDGVVAEMKRSIPITCRKTCLPDEKAQDAIAHNAAFLATSLVDDALRGMKQNTTALLRQLSKKVSP